MPSLTRSAQGWRTLCRYAYTERPFEDVWPWLAQHLWNGGDPLPDGGRSIALRIRPAGVGLSRPLRIVVGGVVCRDGEASVTLHGVDAVHPDLFPELEGVVQLAPVPNEDWPFTQIGVVARYRPPLGPLETVGDRLIGREVADAALTAFIDELAEGAQREIDRPDRLRAPSVAAGPRSGDTTALQRVVLTIDGLGVRPGGAVSASSALQAVPGVAAVSVEPWTGLTAVDYDPTRCTTNQLLVTLEGR